MFIENLESKAPVQGQLHAQISAYKFQQQQTSGACGTHFSTRDLSHVWIALLHATICAHNQPLSCGTCCARAHARNWVFACMRNLARVPERLCVELGAHTITPMHGTMRASTRTELGPLANKPVQSQFRTLAQPVLCARSTSYSCGSVHNDICASAYALTSMHLVRCLGRPCISVCFFRNDVNNLL